VVCAMTSKYAMALYELVQLRAGQDRCIETFPLAASGNFWACDQAHMPMAGISAAR
jgi:hypothetical protein